MKKATISQAKNRLSQLIDWVKGGETVIIMDRNVPVAKLEPIGSTAGGEIEGRLERLERQGLITIGKGRGRISESTLRMPGAKLKKGGDILKALLADREESR